MMITILVAFDGKRIIGNRGKIPWYIPEDLSLFRERTMGHPVIMGRKTWDSLPKKPLTGRINVVISNGLVEIPGGHLTRKSPIYLAADLQEAIHIACLHSSNEIFIIGGGMVYETAMKSGLVDRIIVSQVFGKHKGDTHFPKINWWKWKRRTLEKHEKFDLVEYTIRTWKPFPEI